MSQEALDMSPLGPSPIELDVRVNPSIRGDDGETGHSSESSINSTHRDKILSLSKQSMVNPKASDFTIIWQNLTYKVDSRQWHAKLREKIFRKAVSTPQTSTDQLDTEDGLRSSSGPEPLRRHGEKTILDGICGSAKSRQLTGILGPSGAGKSSLLYCLFQNRTQGVSGRILVDSQSKKRLKVCFIPQKDHLNEWLTVREDLIFVSRLRCARVNLFGAPTQSISNLDQSDQQKRPASTEIKSTYAKQVGKRCSTALIDHEANAFRVAELLGITNCLDVPIRRISGGQKKRLSVARELMSTPDILILDEPTTGLDSLTCNKMISVLADLAHYSAHPMAVIATIHQPQRAVFDQFDKTYFLSARGRVVYDDAPQNVTETLSQVANLIVPAAQHNPASALIEIFSDPNQSYVVELMTSHALNRFQAKYDSNYLRRLMKTKGDAQSWTFCALNEQDSIYSDGSLESPVRATAAAAAVAAPATAPGRTTGSPVTAPGEVTASIRTSDESETANSSELATPDEYFISRQLQDCLSSHSSGNVLRNISHVFTLTHRAWLSVIRDPTMTRSRLMFHAALPLIMLLIFGTLSGSPNNCPSLGVELEISDMRKSIDDGVIKKNLQDTRLAIENISFYFIIMYGFAINIIATTASHYPQTIMMFNKETVNGLYSAGPYFIAQTLADLPLEVFFPSFSVIMGYSLSGQIDSYLEWRMFAVTASVFLSCYSMHALGLLCGSIFINNIQVAVLVGQMTIFPMVVLSGFLRRTARMPPWMRSLSEFSIFKHALKGVVAARYGYNVCECDEDMLPENGQSITFKGMPPRVKHVIEYMFPLNRTNGIPVGDMFDKLGERFVKAQTFALNITSCDDVRPYALEAFEVEDADLYRGALAMLATIIVLKLVTFSIVRVSPYRLD